MMDRVPHEMLIAAEKGERMAITAIRQRADADEPDAQYWLGWFHWEGKAVQQDVEKAAQLFQKAAETGHVVAQFNIATAYLHGRGVPQDAVEALRWTRKAAESGYVDAQFMLAVLLSKEQPGISCNLQESTKWCQRAAEQGHQNAQKLLSMLQGNRPTQLTPEERFAIAIEKLQRTSDGREREQAMVLMAMSAQEGAENARTFYKETYRRFLAAAEDADSDEIAKTAGFLWWLLEVGGHSISQELAITSSALMQNLVGGANPGNEAIERFKELISQAAVDGNDMAVMLLEACPPD